MVNIMYTSESVAHNLYAPTSFRPLTLSLKPKTIFCIELLGAAKGRNREQCIRVMMLRLFDELVITSGKLNLGVANTSQSQQV
ncbi:hypothetical protein VNO77_24292 [Canavalia gladiata]|uniref:Uncharacterized protein n=1 Tax=Canavalia gladiata TaxID=3824 RepID=A0AAN9L6R5_CANGL